MADASLDDFFAKKDKTKKKSKSKFTQNDILAQGAEGLKKSKKKKEKKKENETIETENNTDKVQVEKKEEEYWVDFVQEEEEEKDYSGLRIASLRISQKDGDKDKEQNDEDESEEDDGEQSEDKKEKRDKTNDSPWNNKGNAQPSYERESVSHQKQEALIPAGAVSLGKYVPPSRRGIDGNAMALRTGGGRKSKKVKEAPNLGSESDFPPLGGVSSEGRFEEVRGGSSRQKEDPTPKKMQQLELGNKFGALSN